MCKCPEHRRRCSLSLVTRRMQTEPAVYSLFIPMGTAIIKKTIIEAGTYWHERWVLYVNSEPWESTPKT